MEERNKGRRKKENGKRKKEKGKKKKEKGKRKKRKKEKRKKEKKKNEKRAVVFISALSHIFFSFQFQTDSPSPIDLLKIKSIPFTIHSHNNGMHESNEIKIDR